MVIYFDINRKLIQTEGHKLNGWVSGWMIRGTGVWKDGPKAHCLVHTSVSPGAESWLLRPLALSKVQGLDAPNVQHNQSPRACKA